MADATAKLNVLIALQSKLEGGQSATAFLQKMTSGLLAAAGAMAVYAGKDAIEAGGRIIDLANAASLGTQAIQAFAAVGSEMGLTMEDIARASETMRKGLQSAHENGASPLNRSLAALNLTAVGLQALAPEKQWEEIARAMAHTTDKQAALNAASDLFGEKGFKKMKEFLDVLGTKGLAELLDLTKNVRIDDTKLDALDRFGDKLTRIKNELLAISRSWVATFIEANSSESAPALRNKFGVGYVGPLVAEMNAARGPVTGAPAAAAALADLDQQAADAAAKKKVAAVAAEQRAAMDAATKKFEDERAANEAAMALQKQRYADGGPEAYGIAKTVEQLRDAATAFEATRTPLEAYNAEVQRLNELYEKTGMKEETLARSTADAKARLDAATTIPAAQATLETELRRIAAERAKLEGDFTRTAQEKWAERKKIVADEIAAHQALLATYEKLRDNAPPDSLLRQGYEKNVRGEMGAISSLQGDQSQFGPDPDSYLQQAQSALARLRESWGTTAEQIGMTISGTIGGALDSISSNISGLILGTENWRSALYNVANSIITTVVQSIVQMGVRWVATQIMMAVAGKGLAAASVAASAPIAVAQSAVWAVPATLATIASWGGAAVAAPGFIAAANAMTMAQSLMAGFEEGGWTGGQRGKFAGIVHGEEIVFSAPAVDAIGRDNLLAMHRDALSPSAPASRAGSSTTGANGAAARPKTQVHVVYSEQELNAAIDRYQNNPAFELRVLGITRRDRGA